METFEKVQIRLNSGDIAEAVAPEILSVSRRTDIPAFYADWFFNRLSKGKTGYVDTVNPFNQQKQHVSFQNVKFIVFWSKNPKPMLKYMGMLNRLGIDWYLQYTLNDYPTLYEPNVPEIKDRIALFKSISNLFGRDRIIWRYDPIFNIEGYWGIEQHISKIANILDEIGNYTDKLVFSFADIERYKKVSVNLKNSGAEEMSYGEQYLFAARLRRMLEDKKASTIKVATCSEDVDFSTYDIDHNACIDAKLISMLTSDKDFSKRMADAVKDKGQRSSCLCTNAKDIGVYNTCAHGCKYCYANLTPESAKLNFERLRMDTNKNCLI